MTLGALGEHPNHEDFTEPGPVRSPPQTSHRTPTPMTKAA